MTGASNDMMLRQGRERIREGSSPVGGRRAPWADHDDDTLPPPQRILNGSVRMRSGSGTTATTSTSESGGDWNDVQTRYIPAAPSFTDVLPRGCTVHVILSIRIPHFSTSLCVMDWTLKSHCFSCSCRFLVRPQSFFCICARYVHIGFVALFNRSDHLCKRRNHASKWERRINRRRPREELQQSRRQRRALLEGHGPQNRFGMLVGRNMDGVMTMV